LMGTFTSASDIPGPGPLFGTYPLADIGHGAIYFKIRYTFHDLF
jgi:hypothetical protein